MDDEDVDDGTEKFDPQEVTRGPRIHQRTSPPRGHVKFDLILTSLTESEHKQGSAEIQSTMHSSNSGGGVLLASEMNKIIFLFNKKNLT